MVGSLGDSFYGWIFFAIGKVREPYDRMVPPFSVPLPFYEEADVCSITDIGRHTACG